MFLDPRLMQAPYMGYLGQDSIHLVVPYKVDALSSGVIWDRLW